MAEGMFPDDIACRFFLSGACKDGEKCPFSHDRSRLIPDTVCRYYLQGACIYGENCWYDHVPVNGKKKEQVVDPSRCNENLSSECNSTTGRLLLERNFFQPGFTDLIKDIHDHEEKNSNEETLSCTLTNRNASNCILKAATPEFIPAFKSYADVVKAKTLENDELATCEEICPFFAEGHCPLPNCGLVHGDICEICRKANLHPFNKKAREAHIEKCEKELEQNMEFSFAVQRSLDKACGICMEVVMEKNPLSERRFGILEKCNHVYCLSCIRKWRRTRHHEDGRDASNNVLTRACPECRIPSDFVIPSSYFVAIEDEKKKLIDGYKGALRKKHCKYFKRGNGVCPFGGACFYLHVKEDGTMADLPQPKRRRENSDGILENMQENILWNYIEDRDNPFYSLIVDFNEFTLSSDTDDSGCDSNFSTFF